MSSCSWSALIRQLTPPGGEAAPDMAGTYVLRLFGRLGYLLYALILAATLLWLLFPAEAVHRRLVRAVNEASAPRQWEIGAMELRFPGEVRLRDIEAFAGAGEKTPLIHFSTIVLRPRLRDSLGQRQLVADFQAELARGEVAGVLRVARDGRQVRIDARAQGLRLRELRLLEEMLDRSLEGIAGAIIAASIDLPGRRFEELRADVRIDQGRVWLKRAILHHSSLPFSLVGATLVLDGDNLTISEGKVDSPLFSGEFAGELRSRGVPTEGRLDVHGRLLPRPPLFKGVDNPALLRMLRARLEDNTLPFRISGSLVEPGIHFEEYSALFESLEKE